MRHFMGGAPVPLESFPGMRRIDEQVHRRSAAPGDISPGHRTLATWRRHHDHLRRVHRKTPVQRRRIARGGGDPALDPRLLRRRRTVEDRQMQCPAVHGDVPLGKAAECDDARPVDRCGSHSIDVRAAVSGAPLPGRGNVHAGRQLESDLDLAGLQRRTPQPVTDRTKQVAARPSRLRTARLHASTRRFELYAILDATIITKAVEQNPVAVGLPGGAVPRKLQLFEKCPRSAGLRHQFRRCSTLEAGAHPKPVEGFLHLHLIMMQGRRLRGAHAGRSQKQARQPRQSHGEPWGAGWVPMPRAIITAIKGISANRISSTCR